MAGMFDSPFVFNRAPILGQQYSPQALYPGMFGEGGAFARGGMFGPPQQTLGPKQPDIGVPGWPDLGLTPLPSPDTPPGLHPWQPLPPEAPVYGTPEPPQETGAAPVQQMPSFVQDYMQQMRRGQGGTRANREAIMWMSDPQNRAILSPSDLIAYSSALNTRKRAKEKDRGK